MINGTVRRGLKRLLDNRLIYFRGRRNRDGVVLTFDDGPDPHCTPQVLKQLADYRAKAIFFLIGERAERYPDLVREIRDRGHVLANHTYSHLNDRRGGNYTNSLYLHEIRRCQKLLRDIAHVETTMFRPPRGELNLSNIPAIVYSRHKLIYWSIQGGEWGIRAAESGDSIAEYVISQIRAQDILLLHDDNPKTVTVLDHLLPYLRRRNLDVTAGLR